MHRRAKGVVLRAAVSLGLLALLFRFGGVEVASVRQALRGSDPELLLYALVAYAVLGSIVRGVRWQTLIRALGHRVSFWRCTDLFLVGTFFNQLLPTGFGGDLVRSLLLGRLGVGGARAASSVVVDRAIGIMMLLPLGGLALAFAHRNVPAGVAFALVIAIAIGLAGSLVLLSAHRWRDRLVPVPLVGRLAAWPAGRRFVDAFAEYRWNDLFRASLWSVVFSALLVAANVLVGRAVGIRQAGVVDWCLVVPLVSLSTLLPSVGGWGVREWTYVGLLAWLEPPVPPSQATAVSVFFGAMNLLVAAAGGVRLIGRDWTGKAEAFDALGDCV